MRKYFDFILELIMYRIKGLLLLEGFAEENEPEGEPNNTNKDGNNKEDDTKDGDSKGGNTNKAKSQSNFNINFEDLIAKARKEEKEKLYPQITDLKDKVDDLTTKNNNHLLTIEEKDQKIKDLEKELKELKESKGETESETVKRLNKEIKELKDKLEKAEENTVDKVALEEEIKKEIEEEYKVKLYRLEKLNDPEYRDKVIPELVMGTTKEEIDASLEVSKQRYNEIVSKVVDTASAKLPSGNVDTSKFNTKEISLDEIINLDPTSEEYIKFRQKMGLR